MSKNVLSKAMNSLTVAALSLPSLLSAKNAFAAEALGVDDFFGKDADGNPIGGETFAGDSGLSSGDLVTSISSIIRTALGFLGIVTVVIILYGGFLWMTAGGSEERIKDAKKFIIRGIIGLVIVVAAFTIAQFVITSITGALKTD